jgi:hypothetical protein
LLLLKSLYIDQGIQIWNYFAKSKIMCSITGFLSSRWTWLLLSSNRKLSAQTQMIINEGTLYKNQIDSAKTR